MKTLLNIYRTTFATLHQEWIHGVVNWLKYSPALWRPAIVPDSSLRICTPPAEVRTPYAGVHNSGLMNFRALGAASAFSSSLARINFISLARAGRTPGGADEVMVSRCHKTLAKCSSKRVKLQLRAGHLPQSITGPQHVDCLGAEKGWAPDSLYTGLEQRVSYLALWLGINSVGSRGTGRPETCRLSMTLLRLRVYKVFN